MPLRQHAITHSVQVLTGGGQEPAETVSSWVWNHSHSANGARLVLLAIAHRGEIASASIGELAGMTRLSERSVQIAIRELAALGELAVEFRPGSQSRFCILKLDSDPETPGKAARREPVPPAIQFAVFRRDGHRCVECGGVDDLTIDHVYPWSLGGPDTEDNLQTLCRPCNSRKGARV